MEEKPKRCWIKFSIRTLLIALTVFCLWLGWQVRLIHARKNFISWVNAHPRGVTYENDSDIAEFFARHGPNGEFDQRDSKFSITWYRQILTRNQRLCWR